MPRRIPTDVAYAIAQADLTESERRLINEYLFDDRSRMPGGDRILARDLIATVTRERRAQEQTGTNAGEAITPPVPPGQAVIDWPVIGTVAPRLHAAASMFPEMSTAAFNELAADIARNGMREPITINLRGEIIDGRHRYAAAQRCHMPLIRARVLPDDADPVAFALSANMERRHMNDSQRALVAARYATLPHGVHRSSRPESMTQAQAAARCNVSERYVRDAAFLIACASERNEDAFRRPIADDLLRQVQAGDMSLRAAIIALRPRAVRENREIERREVMAEEARTITPEVMTLPPAPMPAEFADLDSLIQAGRYIATHAVDGAAWAAQLDETRAASAVSNINALLTFAAAAMDAFIEQGMAEDFTALMEARYSSPRGTRRSQSGATSAQSRRDAAVPR